METTLFPCPSALVLALAIAGLASISALLFWKQKSNSNECCETEPLLKSALKKETKPKKSLLLVSCTLAMLAFCLILTHPQKMEQNNKTEFDMSVPEPAEFNYSAVNYADFVRRNGIYLFLGNQRFMPVGTNDYTLPFSSFNDITRALDNFKKIGVNVIRTWLHNEAVNPIPGYIYMHRFNGWTNYVDDAGLTPVDFLIAEAGKRGIRLIMTFNDNWNYYGGAPAYNSWYKLSYHDQFFTEAAPKAAFKRYISAILGRVNKFNGIAYKYDPTVMIWELMNEPRCQSNANQPTRPECAGPLRTKPNMPKPYMIKNWAAEMSQYVKSIAPYHLVALGDDGFVALDGPSVGWDAALSGYYGIDWFDILSIPTIDVGTTHFYPDKNSRTQSEDGVKWINWHAGIARQFWKPVILEEYFSEKSDSQFWLIRPWLEAIVANGGAKGFQGDLVWMIKGTATYTNISSYTVHPNDPYFIPILKDHIWKMSRVQ